MKTIAVIFISLITVLCCSCFLYFIRDTSLGGWEIAGEQYFTEENISALDIIDDPVSGPLLFLTLPFSTAAEPDVRIYNFSGEQWKVYSDISSENFNSSDVYAGILSDGSLCIISGQATGAILNQQGNAWVDIADTDFSTQSNKTAGFSVDGKLYLAVEDYGNSSIISVYEYNSGVWQLLGSDGEFPAADDAWIGFDQTGALLLFLCNSIYEDSLAIHRWEDPAWTALAAFPSWALTPGLCMQPIAASDTKLWCLVGDERAGFTNIVVLEYKGAEWIETGTESFSKGYAYGQNLLAGKDGDPLLSLREETALKEISVKKNNGTSWEFLGVPGFTFGDSAWNSDMMIGSDGYLYVAYSATGHNSRAAVMRYLLETN